MTIGLPILSWLPVFYSFGFLSPLGAVFLFADYLDQFTFFGFKLGFWFAQQGSIYVFVILIFIYIHKMQKLDQKFKNSSDKGN